MCPADILANNLIVNAIGLIMIPNNSTGTKMNFTANGTPGGFKVCAQKCLLELAKIATKENKDKDKVTAIFPVTLAENGVNPIISKNHIKKNNVNNNGM